MPSWTTSDIPSQNGRTVVVTGTGGLGFEDALALARAGAHVVVPARRPDVAREALAGTGAEIDELDLADLGSVSRFAERFLGSGRHVDMLIGSAGVMACPETRVTKGGLLRVFGWYDNEWGFSNRMLDVALRMG